MDTKVQMNLKLLLLMTSAAISNCTKDTESGTIPLRYNTIKLELCRLSEVEVF